MDFPTNVPWWAALLGIILPAPVIIRIVRFVDGWTKRKSELQEEQSKVSASVTISSQREETARQRLAVKERDRDTPYLVKQLERCDDERQRISGERNRLAAENVAFIEEISKLSFENIALKERIDLLEKEMVTHRRQRDLDVAWSRSLLQWVMKEFIPRDPNRLSQPPERIAIIDSAESPIDLVHLRKVGSNDPV